MLIDGTLDQFPLRELIEMAVYSSVTGVLEVRVGKEVGQLFFRDGRPYHAVAGSLRGTDALCLMFEERDAPFRFVAAEEHDEETLWQDPWDLIARGEQEAEQWLLIRPKIPSIDWIPVFCSSIPTQQVQIQEETWQVLSAIDGQRSIAAIAEFLFRPAVEICRTLLGPIEQGLVAVHQPRPALLRPTPIEHPGRSTGGSFFERLLAGIPPQQEGPSDSHGDPSNADTSETDPSQRYHRYHRIDDR